MVRLRLRRVGRKGQASFRIVAASKQSPRDGKFLEIVGSYNPRTQPETVILQEDRIYHWMSEGAQPSESVARILKTVGALDRFERFKAGESAEKLLAEAEKAAEDRKASPKTRFAAPKKSKKKAAAAAAEAAAPAVKEEAPVVEAVAEAVAEVVEEVVAEVVEEVTEVVEEAAEAAEVVEEATEEAPADEEAAE